MNTIRYSVFFILFSYIILQAQNKHDWLTIQASFKIKQVDEFFARFNYQEKPNSEAVTIAATHPNFACEREEAIYALFDANLFRDKQVLTDIQNFASQITSSHRLISLDFYDDNWYAKAKCKVLYNNQPETIILTLQNEVTAPQTSKWVIKGIEADFLRLTPECPANSMFIPPNAHETNFISLGRALENTANASLYAHKGFEEDILSLFFYAVKTGNLSLNYVEALSFHFLQVDNWVFTLEKFNRMTSNSGWLITKLLNYPEKQKELYKKKELFIP